MNQQKVVFKRVRVSEAAKYAEMVKAKDWGKDNELEDFDEQLLHKFLLDKDNVLIVAEINGIVAGMVQAYILRKPSKESDWLYIDEVDVRPSYRNQGVGKGLMAKVLEIADDLGVEAWLGTETDNASANGLYKSINPDQIEKFIGYTYKPKKK